MEFGKSVSRLLAKFMLVSTATSCLSCCSYAMEDKNISNKEEVISEENLQSMAEKILKQAFYMVVESDNFIELVRNYIRIEFLYQVDEATDLEQRGRISALYILKDKEKFSKLLPDFAKSYVDKHHITKK